jgi:hypothetical protein
MTHVDVVKNEWLAGYQLVVARVSTRDASGIDIDAREPWDALVERYRRESGLDGEAFVASLHEHLHGDYLFATRPHGEEECPFHAMVVPLSAVDWREKVEAVLH